MNSKEKNLLLSLFRLSLDEGIKNIIKKECIKEDKSLSVKICEILGIDSYKELGYRVLDSKEVETKQEYVKNGVIGYVSKRIEG